MAKKPAKKPPKPVKGGHKKPRRKKGEKVHHAHLVKDAFAPDPTGKRVVVRPYRQYIERTPGASTYTLEKAKKICERLVGGESLWSVTRDADMPGWGTIYDWQKAHPEFEQMMLLARFDQADTFADQALFIADNTELGEKRTTDRFGTKIEQHDMIEHRKLRIETRRWFAGVMKPHKYGQKIALAGVPNEPLEQKWGITFPPPPGPPVPPTSSPSAPGEPGDLVPHETNDPQDLTQTQGTVDAEPDSAG